MVKIEDYRILKKKIARYNKKVKKEAKRLAKRMGLKTADSVIGKTTAEQYYFIKGARNALKRKRRKR